MEPCPCLPQHQAIAVGLVAQGGRYRPQRPVHPLRRSGGTAAGAAATPSGGVRRSAFPTTAQPGLAGAAGSNPPSVPGRGMLALHRSAARSGAERDLVAGSAQLDGGGVGGGALAAHHRNLATLYGFAGAATGGLIRLSKSGFKGQQRRFKTIYRCSYCC